MVRKGRPHPRRKVGVRMEYDERNTGIIAAVRRGRTYADIAAEYNLSVRQTQRIADEALTDIQRGLFTEIEKYRAQALDRYGALLDAVWDRAMLGDEKSVESARRLVDSIGRITGVLSEVTVRIGESDVDRALRELDQLLNRRAAEVEGQVVASALEAGPAEEADVG